MCAPAKTSRTTVLYQQILLRRVPIPVLPLELAASPSSRESTPRFSSTPEQSVGLDEVSDSPVRPSQNSSEKDEFTFNKKDMAPALPSLAQSVSPLKQPQGRNYPGLGQALTTLPRIPVKHLRIAEKEADEEIATVRLLLSRCRAREAERKGFRQETGCDETECMAVRCLQRTQQTRSVTRLRRKTGRMALVYKP